MCVCVCVCVYGCMYNTPPSLAGPSGIRAGRSVEINADSRSKGPQVRLSHLRVGELQH